MKKLDFLLSLSVILILFNICFSFVSVNSEEIGVSVRVVEGENNVSIVTGRAASPLEKIAGMMSLTSKVTDNKISILIIVALIILIVYIIIKRVFFSKKEKL